VISDGSDPIVKHRQDGVHAAATEPVHYNSDSSDVIIDHRVESVSRFLTALHHIRSFSAIHGVYDRL